MGPTSILSAPSPICTAHPESADLRTLLGLFLMSILKMCNLNLSHSVISYHSSNHLCCLTSSNSHRGLMPPSVSVVLSALMVSKRFLVFNSEGVRLTARLCGLNMKLHSPVNTVKVTLNRQWRCLDGERVRIKSSATFLPGGVRWGAHGLLCHHRRGAQRVIRPHHFATGDGRSAAVASSSCRRGVLRFKE